MPQDLDLLTISRIVLRARRPDNCPYCGCQHVARIAYGFLAQAEPGESEADIVPGGCVITLNAPHWQCKSCSRGIFDDGLARAIARELQVQNQIKESTNNADSEGEGGSFETFAEARDFAISEARDSGNSVSVERRKHGWFVPTVEQERWSADKSEAGFRDWYASWSEDLEHDDLVDYDSEISEISAEIGDYGACLARSEEEGWFYDDENEDEVMRRQLQEEDDEVRGQCFS